MGDDGWRVLALQWLVEHEFEVEALFDSFIVTVMTNGERHPILKSFSTSQERAMDRALHAAHLQYIKENRNASTAGN